MALCRKTKEGGNGKSSQLQQGRKGKEKTLIDFERQVY